MSTLAEQPEPRAGPDGGRRDVGPLPPRIIVRPSAVAPALVPAITSPSAEPFAEDLVGARPDQGADPGLVAAAEEDPGGVAQRRLRRVRVGVGPAAHPQFPGVLDAELAEYLLVLGVHLVGDAGRGGDQRDPGLVAPAQFDEPFQDTGAAAQVLAAANDEQAARGTPLSACSSTVALLPRVTPSEPNVHI